MSIEKRHKGEIKPRERSICWCGSADFKRFSPTYVTCQSCQTLVLERWPAENQFKVTNDESDFYGRQYYDTHLVNDYGQASLQVRSRTDLPERCLHWFRTILKYKLPRGKFLEIGSGHGGLVFMAKMAGLDSSGLELSPRLVEYSQDIFGVSMLLGPVEVQNIGKKSCDVIAMMDVLEHLPHPVESLTHVLEFLKDDGVLLIQTPVYDPKLTYEDLNQRGSRFLEHLKEEEHLFLFSEQSVLEFFHRLGADFLNFEPAYFHFYDMFLVVGKQQFEPPSRDHIAELLSTSPTGRIMLAMLDLSDEREDLKQRLRTSEVDRVARLQVIVDQGARLGEIEGNRNVLQAQIDELKSQFTFVENDWRERLVVIEQQGRILGETEGEVNRLRAQLASMQRQFEGVEADRAARLEVITNQGKALGELEGERNRLTAQLQDVKEQFEGAEADRAARLEIITNQGKALGELEGERNRLTAQLQDVKEQFEGAELDRAARLEIIREQGARLGKLEGDRNRLRSHLDDVLRQFEKSEADRAARLEVIKQQGDTIGDLEAARSRLGFQAEEQHRQLRELAVRVSTLVGQVESLDKKLFESEDILKEQVSVNDAQVQQVRALTRQLRSLQELFIVFQRSHAYRLLRGLGGLSWMEDALVRFAADNDPDEGKDDKSRERP